MIASFMLFWVHAGRFRSADDLAADALHQTLKLHVAFGDGEKPATEFKLKEIDLGKWLKR